MGKRRDKAVAILATLLGKEAAAALVPDRHRERDGPNVKSWNGQTLGPASEARRLTPEEIAAWSRKNGLD